MTLGMLLVEYFWTQATRPMPWPVEMMPWAVLFAGVTGAGIGMVATWMHQRLTVVADPDAAPALPSRERHPGRWALAGALAVLAVFVVNVPPDAPHGGTADVAVGPEHHGRAYLTVRTDPHVVKRAYWFEALSWQGGGFIHSDLQPARRGVWRTDVPIPLTGKWKTLIRLHTPLHTLAAAPVYLPSDPAIPASQYPPSAGRVRSCRRR